MYSIFSKEKHFCEFIKALNLFTPVFTEQNELAEIYQENIYLLLP